MVIDVTQLYTSAAQLLGDVMATIIAIGIVYTVAKIGILWAHRCFATVSYDEPGEDEYVSRSGGIYTFGSDWHIDDINRFLDEN